MFYVIAAGRAARPSASRHLHLLAEVKIKYPEATLLVASLLKFALPSTCSAIPQRTCANAEVEQRLAYTTRSAPAVYLGLSLLHGGYKEFA